MQCQEVRKRKELELQILTESIRLWEGDDIKTLGSVLYMSQVLVQSPGSEVSQSGFLFTICFDEKSFLKGFNFICIYCIFLASMSISVILWVTFPERKRYEPKVLKFCGCYMG